MKWRQMPNKVSRRKVRLKADLVAVLRDCSADPVAVLLRWSRLWSRPQPALRCEMTPPRGGRRRWCRAEANRRHAGSQAARGTRLPQSTGGTRQNCSVQLQANLLAQTFVDETVSSADAHSSRVRQVAARTRDALSLLGRRAAGSSRAATATFAPRACDWSFAGDGSRRLTP